MSAYATKAVEIGNHMEPETGDLTSHQSAWNPCRVDLLWDVPMMVSRDICPYNIYICPSMPWVLWFLLFLWIPNGPWWLRIISSTEDCKFNQNVVIWFSLRWWCLMITYAPPTRSENWYLIDQCFHVPQGIGIFLFSNLKPPKKVTKTPVDLILPDI